MSYIINLTNGNVFTTLQDGTTNTNTGLTLIGRNFPNYGQIQNENLIKLLENFADVNPPYYSSQAVTPLTGTLWFDSGNNLLKVFDGANWYPVSQRIVGTSAPTADNVGDQWYDSTNKQLFTWSGTSWDLVGPLYKASQGLTGTIAGSITDNLSVTHNVGNVYVAGTLIGIYSADSTFTPGSTISGFTTIAPGLNLASNVTVNGTVLNAQQLGNITAANYARTDITPTFTRDITVSGNVLLGQYANIRLNNSNTLEIVNKAYQANISVHVNTTNGNVRAIQVDGASGLVTVAADPVSPLGVVTKNYADTNFSTINTNLTDLGTTTNTAISQLTASTTNNLNTAVNLINSNVSSLAISTGSSINVINTNIGFLFANAAAQDSAISGLRANITAANAAIVTANVNMKSYVDERNTLMVANVNAANTAIVTANTGVVSYINSLISSQTANVTAANAAIVTANVNMKSYVDTTEAALNTSLLAAIASATSNTGTALNTKANIQAPVFTANGSIYPQTVSPPSGDSSNKIPTTSWTASAITAAVSAANVPHITVSTNGPSGGADGDFWFQVGS